MMHMIKQTCLALIERASDDELVSITTTEKGCDELIRKAATEVLGNDRFIYRREDNARLIAACVNAAEERLALS